MCRYVRSAILFLFSFVVADAAAAQRTISWSTVGREFRSSGGEPVTLVCPASGEFKPVWGSMLYTDDSSVCTAAVHAGAIRATEGGTIILKILPGRGSYSASRRNGVASEEWGEWETSFSVERAPAPPPPPPPPPPVAQPAAAPAVISWQQTAGRLAPNGRRFTFQCPARGTAAPVKGRDLYSWDSSICTAAVHAGAITLERGGVVTIEMRPGARAYTGGARNGIISTAGEHTTLGFIVLIRTSKPGPS